MSYSKSVFFIPVRIEDYSVFTKALEKDGRWAQTAQELYSPNYLLHYAARIAKDPELFRSFSLKNPDLPIYRFEKKLQLPQKPKLDQVRFSCFSTGMAFLEFWVDYDRLTPEQITDFAYRFKKATQTGKEPLPIGEIPLYDAATGLLPKSVEAKPFFTATADFKCECSCYHFIHLDESPTDEAKAMERLNRLSRSYSTNFILSSESDYDMVYKAGANDHWGGSSEGLVNITYDEQEERQFRYLHEFKPRHLSVDYYFMYLLLLNQRFTAMRYIDDVAAAMGKSSSEIEKLNRHIVQLKAVFSFNVISDDKIFQNVYSRMCHILEIEHLLADLIDNEGQMQVLQNAAVAKSEKLSSGLLTGLSLLSLFSALIDASSYFDRFHAIESISTALSLFCVTAILILSIIWLIRRNK